MSESSSIEVIVNGASQKMTEGLTVGRWLADAGREPSTVAIELNGEILPRNRYPETVFVDGDKLEVVQFVQGG